MRIFILFFILSIATLPAFSQNYTEVVAEKGDGVFTLLRRYGLNPSEHLQTFLEINQKLLGENNSLFAGKTYLLPPSGSGTSITASTAPPAKPAVPVRVGRRIIEMPLFGEKYARVEVKDETLKGAVYYLSSGHGGPDPGAVGKYGANLLSEDEYAYDVTIRLARSLMERGATVYMIIQDQDDGIRDDNILKIDYDEINYPNEKVSAGQRERLKQRTDAINRLYAQHKGSYQRMLEIHVDSRSKSQNIDVFFYHHENSPLGKKLADNIHQTFTDKYRRHQPNRDYFGNVSHRSSLYVVKYSHPPTVFIELGNIKNELDQRRFVIPNNRQALANWIVDGIISDYKGR